MSDVGPRAALRLIRSRDFGPYFAGNAFSASGTWFQNLAAALLVYRLTHSALLLGVLNFAQFAAIVVLSPWTGSAADRLDRRRLLLATQVSSTVLSALLAALAWGGRAGTGAVVAFSLLLGVGSAFAAPVQQAFVTSIVPASDLRTGPSSSRSSAFPPPSRSTPAPTSCSPPPSSGRGRRRARRRRAARRGC